MNHTAHDSESEVDDMAEYQNQDGQQDADARHGLGELGGKVVEGAGERGAGDQHGGSVEEPIEKAYDAMKASIAFTTSACGTSAQALISP